MSSAPIQLLHPDRSEPSGHPDLKGAKQPQPGPHREQSELVRQDPRARRWRRAACDWCWISALPSSQVVFPLAPADPYGHRLVIEPYEEALRLQLTPVRGTAEAIVIAIVLVTAGKTRAPSAGRTYENR